jgi:hypothetical protein
MARAKNKRKYFIDTKLSIELLAEGYGYKVTVMNWYQFRISSEESEAFWDWYHTTGAVVINRKNYCTRWGTYGDAEYLALAIKNYIYN